MNTFIDDEYLHNFKGKKIEYINEKRLKKVGRISDSYNFYDKHYINVIFDDGSIIKRIDFEFALSKCKLRLLDSVENCSSEATQVYSESKLEAANRALIRQYLDEKKKANKKCEVWISIPKETETLSCKAKIISYYIVCEKSFIDVRCEDGNVYQEVEVYPALERQLLDLAKREEKIKELECIDYRRRMSCDKSEDEQLKDIFKETEDLYAGVGEKRTGFGGCYGEDDRESEYYNTPSPFNE